jgi:NitT/TauT family transport system substrate-binding protein
VDVSPGFPNDLKPYMQEQAEILLREKKIAAIPDWAKALRPDFMEKARAGA